jgi:predicted acetyltransferase
VAQTSGVVILRPLRSEDESAVVQASAEFLEDDFAFLPHLPRACSFADHVALLERQRLGRDLPATHVPSTFLVAEVDGEIVGRTYLRHRLNDRLRRDGGHVGFGVRPRFRGRGHGTAILRRSLGILASMGIDEALVTVAPDNVASRRTVERCGGRLQDVVTVGLEQRRCRYWVPTSS